MFDECIVLIPCSTLEDFPRNLAEEHARGLLAAWTAPWHPRFLAALGKLPQWARADTLPPVLQRSVLLVPEASRKRLPSRFDSDTQGTPDCRVVHGNCRAELVTQLADAFAVPRELLDAACEPASGSATGEATAGEATTSSAAAGEAAVRSIEAADFYALAYAWLQVQLMTRRLRYTSNLDEIYFAGRAVAAATAFVQGNAQDAATALHDAFDCLAEERDHYFSSDPHLVDLTLLAPTTLGASLEQALADAQRAGEPPVNFLLDTSLARQVRASDAPGCVRLRALIDEQVVGVAGGGPPEQINLHHQTAAGAQQAIAAAREEMTQQLGPRCDVYARSAGETPGDIGPVLAANGYIGAIPIDLAAGSGWREESKLIWHSGPPQLDALVARPIDASQAHGFLSLGPDLGQSIDSGEIATALLVHWPGAYSDAYLDLRRAASWGLALGRFWKIDDYFREGERPFHHYRGRPDEGAANWLRRSVQTGASDPLATAANAYREAVTAESAEVIAAMAVMVAADPAAVATALVPAPVSAATASSQPAAAALQRAVAALGSALGGSSDAAASVPQPAATPAENPPQQLLLVNPHPISLRSEVRLRGLPAGDQGGASEQVFGWSRGRDGACEATVDVPGGGFLFLGGTGRAARRSWFKRRRRIAAGTRLANEFMEVEVSAAGGGVRGVYSGSGRGNRYSLRLCYVDGPADSGAGSDAASEPASDPMVADAVEVIRSDEAAGEIRSRGRLRDPQGQEVADFEIVYRLARGSRWLEVAAKLQPREGIQLGEDPWQSYFAFRSAVATDALSLLVPLRETLHRASSNSKQIDSPAGVVIDEVDNQTLLYTDGRPAHRRVGDRFVDSLLIVRGESTRQFTMRVGFDVREPVAALRAAACPPPALAVTAAPANQVGWLIACATPDVVLTGFRVESTQPRQVSLLVITTRSESRKVKLRFCRDVVAAERYSGDPASPFSPLTLEGDQVQIAMTGHEVIRLRVTLRD